MSLTWTALRRIHWSRLTRDLYSSPHRIQRFSSVFEPEGSEDYQALSSLPTQPSRPTLKDLPSLVQDGHFQMAEAIRDELIEQGVDIPFDTVYEDAALWTLGSLHRGMKSALPMCRWLALYPEYSTMGTNGLHRTRDFLLAYPALNVHLIYRFAQVAASKGYSEMVQHQLMPIIAKFGNQPMVESMVEDLRLRSLPAKLQEPSVDDSSSVFEDMDASGDYVFASSTHGAVSSPVSPIENLHLLIRLGDYHSAKRLLSELRSLETDVPPSPIFEAASVLALQVPDLSENERLSDFRFWFSLVPTAPSAGENKFYAVRRQIFWAPVANLHIILEFGLICAEKGYAVVVNSVVIPVIMRYAPPEASFQFITEYEARHLAFLKSQPPRHRRVRDFTLLRSRTIRGIAIRHLADAGHFDVAMRLLPEGKLKGYLNVHTYQILLHRLLQTDDPKYDEYVRTIRGILEEITIAHGGMIDAADEASLASTLYKTADATKLDMPLPQTLQYMKAALMDHKGLPHANTIMDFMAQYSSTGRTKALELLRRRAYRGSHHAASLWVFAEMVLNYRHGLYRNVLQNFLDNFFLAGVPRAEIFRLLHSRDHYEYDESFPPSVASEPVVDRTRIFPSRAHCALVWQSLAQLTKTPVRLDSLYSKLLLFADHKGHVTDEYFASSNSPALSSFSPSLPAPPLSDPPSCSVVSESFTPFMMRMMHSSGPYAGTRILKDMVNVGLQPTVYHFTELARYYAFNGQEQKAFHVLNRLEMRLDREERAQKAMSSTQAQDVKAAPDSSNQAMNEPAIDQPSDDTGPALEESRETLDGLARLQHQSDTGSLPDDPGQDSGSFKAGAAGPENTATASDQINPDSSASLSAGLSEKHNALPGQSSTHSTNVPDPSQHSARRSSTQLPSADFILYVALMRAFLGAHNLPAVAEVARRLQVRYPYVKGKNQYLDKVYRDWGALSAAERRRQMKENFG